LIDVYAVTQPEQADALLDHLEIERGLADGAVSAQVVHPISVLAAAYRRESSGGAS
jgi:hypothetical protein